MATTAESIRDGLIWLRDLAIVWLRWGLVFGFFVGLFAFAVWATRGVDYGDCSLVAPEDQAKVDNGQALGIDGLFGVQEGDCVRGVYVARVTGLEGDLEEVVAELNTYGWSAEGTLLPYYYNLEVRCLRHSEPGLEHIELSVFASRAGEISMAEIRATEGDLACENIGCRTLSTGCERYDRLEATE